MNLFKKRLIFSALLLIFIGGLGTIGYYIISDGHATLVDCFYMTAITVTTIGYGEIIPLHDNPGGRIFTIVLALFGVGAFTYIVTNLTAFFIDRDVFLTYSRKRIIKMIANLENHYIICGTGDIGLQIARELHQTKRAFVLVDKDVHKTDNLEELKKYIKLEADATEDSSLIEAGVQKAAGVFAVTGDDNYNLVITFTARQLNPNLRIISKVRDINQSDKIKRAGADSVISPYLIGGMRIVSEMIRPEVVSFLDGMLRDKEANLRVEEIALGSASEGKSISDYSLHGKRDTLLLAMKKDGRIIFNPAPDTKLSGAEVLIFMVSPEGREKLRQQFDEH